MPITYRDDKGTNLDPSEVDANFRALVASLSALSGSVLSQANAYTDQKVLAVTGIPPASLATLQAIAAALSSDQNALGTLTSLVNQKQNILVSGLPSTLPSTVIAENVSVTDNLARLQGQLNAISGSFSGNLNGKQDVVVTDIPATLPVDVIANGQSVATNLARLQGQLGNLSGGYVTLGSDQTIGGAKSIQNKPFTFFDTPSTIDSSYTKISRSGIEVLYTTRQANLYNYRLLFAYNNGQSASYELGQISYTQPSGSFSRQTLITPPSGSLTQNVSRQIAWPDASGTVALQEYVQAQIAAINFPGLTGVMQKSTYDPNNVAANVYNVDNHISGTNNKLFTAGYKVYLDKLVAAIAGDGQGNLGIGTTAPNATALVEMASTTRGFLPPRMTGTQRDTIASPVAGLQLFNTTTKTPDYFDGSVWKSILQYVAGQGIDNNALLSGKIQTNLNGYNHIGQYNGYYINLTYKDNATDSISSRYSQGANFFQFALADGTSLTLNSSVAGLQFNGNNPVGLTYAADYSANYQNLSIPHVGWVQAQLAAINTGGKGMLSPVQDIAALQTVAVTAANDKFLIHVENAGVYSFDYQSTATADGVTVVTPGGGTGRWIKIVGVSSAHNLLDALQGGATGEYYHLTSAERTRVQALPTFPASLAGSGGKSVRVKPDATGLEFVDSISLFPSYFTEAFANGIYQWSFKNASQFLIQSNGRDLIVGDIANGNTTGFVYGGADKDLYLMGNAVHLYKNFSTGPRGFFETPLDDTAHYWQTNMPVRLTVAQTAPDNTEYITKAWAVANLALPSNFTVTADGLSFTSSKVNNPLRTNNQSITTGVFGADAGVGTDQRFFFGHQFIAQGVGGKQAQFNIYAKTSGGTTADSITQIDLLSDILTLTAKIETTRYEEVVRAKNTANSDRVMGLALINEGTEDDTFSLGTRQFGTSKLFVESISDTQLAFTLVGSDGITRTTTLTLS